PGGVDGAAVMLRAAIDMGRGRGAFAADGGIAERGVEAHMLMRHGDDARHRTVVMARLRHRFLVEGELRPGGEEQVIDAAHRHRGDHRIAAIIRGNGSPIFRFSSHNSLPFLLCSPHAILPDIRCSSDGAQGRNRTTDTVIFSHVLYQLSYLGAAPGGPWLIANIAPTVQPGPPSRGLSRAPRPPPPASPSRPRSRPRARGNCRRSSGRNR